MRLVSDRSAQQIREDRQEGVELRSRAHRLVQNGTDVRCQLAVQRSTVLLFGHKKDNQSESCDWP